MKIFKDWKETKEFSHIWRVVYIEKEKTQIIRRENTLIVRDIIDAMKKLENYLYHIDQLPTPEHEDLITKEKEHKAKDIFSPFHTPKKVNTSTKWTVNKVAIF